jgi:acyl transferase domain-containing protein
MMSARTRSHLAPSCPARQARGYLYHDGMPESRSGHCCTFDAEACGTMFGDGTGTVMLRLLGGGLHTDAADSPLAVLAGYGINNDGCRKASFNAPSVPGQRDAVVRAPPVATRLLAGGNEAMGWIEHQLTSLRFCR